jgi:glycosyltransferase involved in cell wall biosynthesis
MPEEHVILRASRKHQVSSALRVCFVAPHAYPLLAEDANVRFVGGAELQQSLLAKVLATRGHQVSMVCLDHGQPDQVQIQGVTVHKAFSAHSGIPGFRFFHPRLTGLWRAMGRADAEIYYQRAAGMLTGVVAQFCRQHHRKSVYAAAHDSDFIPGRQYITLRRDRWLFEYGLRHVDALLAQNPVQQGLCRLHYGRTARMARNCYIAPRSATRDPQGYVLWVSTLRAFKRPELLLDLARALPHIQFRMIGGPGGDSPSELGYYHRLEHEARQIANVEFLGFIPFTEIEAHFDGASLLVSTSEQEGFPNTFLQAWARGIPTVSYFDPGLPPARAPICAVAHDTQQACNLLRRLRSDRRAWESLSDRCHRYFLARHTPAAVVPPLERFLGSLEAVGT